MIFEVLGVYFFTGNMNLFLWMTALLLGNDTARIDLRLEGQPIDELEHQQQSYLQNAEEYKQTQWQQYKNMYSKYYEDDEEDQKRMNIFFDNSKLIDDHNKLYYRGMSTYELGHNEFSDLAYEEFLEQYTTHRNSVFNSDYSEMKYLKPTVRNDPTVRPGTTVWNDPKVRHDTTVWNDPTVRNDLTVRNGPTTVESLYAYEQKSFRDDTLDFMVPENIMMPYAVDWRATGAVTPVKNQGRCKASWLFSATGALEGQVYRKTHNLTALSEQNILDCSDKYGNDGCHNGTTLNSFRYILMNGGIDTNSTYPWYGKKSWFCHYKKNPTNPRIFGMVKIQSGNETALQAAVATVGPIAVGVDASSRKFRFYKRGIYNDPHCRNSALNHEMLVVGYGRNFWIVKNSFGKHWGENGYILMMKGYRNQCGIATRALYPLI